MNTARCLLSEAKVNYRFWPEVIKTAAYLKNRIITNTYEYKTPFEIFFGKKPNISNLKLYGSKVFARVPEVKRISKWDRKADVGILVGYEQFGYRVLIDNKIIVARHVEFVNEYENLIGFKGADKSDEESVISVDENSEPNEKIEKEINSKKTRKLSNKSDGNGFDRENEIRKSARERKKDRYGQINTNYIYVNVVSADSPMTYKEALKSNDHDLWKEAMDREINCLNKNKTGQIVKKPKDKRVLDLKWVFTNKFDNRKKARLVVRGFQQKADV